MDSVIEKLEEVRELISDYVDTDGGFHNEPRPNKAMEATRLLEEAIGELKPKEVEP